MSREIYSGSALWTSKNRDSLDIWEEGWYYLKVVKQIRMDERSYPLRASLWLSLSQGHFSSTSFFSLLSLHNLILHVPLTYSSLWQSDRSSKITSWEFIPCFLLQISEGKTLVGPAHLCMPAPETMVNLWTSSLGVKLVQSLSTCWVQLLEWLKTSWSKGYKGSTFPRKAGSRTDGDQQL